MGTVQGSYGSWDTIYTFPYHIKSSIAKGYYSVDITSQIVSGFWKMVRKIGNDSNPRFFVICFTWFVLFFQNGFSSAILYWSFR